MYGDSTLEGFADFSILYAEAQWRYLESVSPYARRLLHQMEVPEVDEIEGLPPAESVSRIATVAMRKRFSHG